MTTDDTVRGLFVSLDKFAHVQKRLSILWGSADCRQYLVSLIPDASGKTGFPISVVSALKSLLLRHDALHPKFAVSKGGSHF